MEFLRQGDVGQIAGDGDMVKASRSDVLRHGLQRTTDMNMTAAHIPRRQPQNPLGRQCPQPGLRQGSEMGVREMGKTEHRSLNCPISLAGQGFIA
jgi:hypothetical protein